MEENTIEINKQYLCSTGKWMKFMGILMIIGCVFMLIIAITCFAGASFLKNIPNVDNNPILQFPYIAGIVYLIIAGIYIIPITYMLRAANAAKNYADFNNDADLTTYFSNNKSYWKFCGILCIISLAIGVLCLLFGIIAAIAIAV